MSNKLWRFLKRAVGDLVLPRDSAVEGTDGGSLPVSPAPASSKLTSGSDIDLDPNLPRSFYAGTPFDGAFRPRWFDPALLQYRSAFRPGDPNFQDQETGRRWAVLRRQVTDHVLRRIAESTFGDHLISRGSRLIKAWFGDIAREPGDLDWVSDFGPTSHDPNPLFERLIEAVFAGLPPEGIALDREGVATDEIWTYDRTPGRRLVFPWRTSGLPGGVVQVDVTFGERLAVPDTRVALPIADGGCVSVRAAGPAQSLAWKLLWLWTDAHAQGKDLYDAALLAGQCSLSRETLEETFRLGGEDRFNGKMSVRDFLSRLSVEWDHFAAEYPWVEGGEADWKSRLEQAIGPFFGTTSTLQRVPDAPCQSTPAWITPRVVEIARRVQAEQAWDELPRLHGALLEAGCNRPDFLDHCLKVGPHTRGCGVIDRLLQDAATHARLEVDVDEPPDGN